MSTSWQQQLDGASSEAQIVSIARDFVARFDPAEIHSLPEPCRPGKIVDGGDVTEFAFALVRHRCEHDQRTTVLVHKLVTFFSSASARLAQITAVEQSPGN